MSFNFTISEIKSVKYEPFLPSQGCFDWCVDQQIAYTNNLDIYVFMFALVSYFLLGAAETIKETKYHQYTDLVIYLAKLSLLIFIGGYILFVRLRLYV